MFHHFCLNNRKTILKPIIGILISLLLTSPTIAKTQIPQLKQVGNETQILVDGKPFFMLGGELGNSSASDIKYMENVWPKLKAMNLNTLLVPVYWELIEPTEGEFNFNLLKSLIKRARKEDIKLTLLWFASWKNSMSTYAPSWVKRDQKRFPRAVSSEGINQEILSPLSKNNLNADKNAFVAMMTFLKEFDGSQHTVILLQVENEIGMLPSARDYHPAANKAYNESVPPQLISYMQANKSILVKELKEAWSSSNFRIKGSWSDIFGDNLATEEIFIAWNFARYTDEIAKAGKTIHPIPMVVNAALNRPNVKPGKYPSGGPLPHLMDIWKAGAPSIDLLVPDFYNPRFKHWNDLYTQQGDALLIPEIRFDNSVGAKSLFAFGAYNCLGFSPFSIESTEAPKEETLAKSYALLEQAMPLLAKYPAGISRKGIWLTKENPEQSITLGKYEFTIKHDLTLGWSSHAKDDIWPHSGGIIFQTGEEDFILLGTGMVITVKPSSGKGHAGIDQYYEGEFIKGKWVQGRSLNGDQSHQGRHLRIEDRNWKIQKIRLYQYK